MRLHVAEGAGAVAVAFRGAGGDPVALGAVADLVLAAGLGVGDGLGVFLAVLGVEADCPSVKPQAAAGEAERPGGECHYLRRPERARAVSPTAAPPRKA